MKKELFKTCSKCGELLPVTYFHKRRNRKGEMTRRAQCRTCFHQARGKAGEKVRYA